MAINIPRHTSNEVLYPPGIEINSFEELYMQKIAQETIYENHRASFYHIFRYKGEGSYHYIEGRKIKMAHDSLLIVNCDIIQRYSRHKCNGDMVLFNSTFFSHTAEKTDFLAQCTLLKNDYIIIPPGSKRFLSSVELYFHLMKTELNKKERLQTDIVLLRNWLHNLLIVIEREYQLQEPQTGLSTGTHNYMRQFKDLLNIYYQIEKQVHFYAKEICISDKKLSQVVSEIHGIPAKEYINEKILLESVRLLESTTLNQYEIAEKLGYDFTYYIKFFRRHFGITPTKYRDSKHSRLG